jgi:hypothetical protein
VVLEPPSSVDLNSFIKEVITWRNKYVNKSNLVLRAQLVQKAMNKAFSLFILLKAKDRMGNDTLSTVAERFCRIILSSFSSFEKNVLGDDSVVVLQNVGVEKRTDKIKVDAASFQQDPSYQINIRPLLADSSSITYALSRHPLFTWVANADGADTLLVKSATRRTNVPTKTMQRVNTDTTPENDVSLRTVSLRINKLLRPHTETIKQAINSTSFESAPYMKIKFLIEKLCSDPIVNRGRKLITSKRPEMYALLLAAARKLGMESNLEAWRTS